MTRYVTEICKRKKNQFKFRVRRQRGDYNWKDYFWYQTGLPADPLWGEYYLSNCIVDRLRNN